MLMRPSVTWATNDISGFGVPSTTFLRHREFMTYKSKYSSIRRFTPLGIIRGFG